MNPNRIRPADPVCDGCKGQVKTVALIEGFGFPLPNLYRHPEGLG